VPKKKKQLNIGKKLPKEDSKKEENFFFSPVVKRKIWGVVMLVVSLILILAFFNVAGVAGEFLTKIFFFAFGKAAYLIPFWFFLAGLIFFNLSPTKGLFKLKSPLYLPTFLGISCFILGMSGILGAIGKENGEGGFLGYFITWPFFKMFGLWPTLIIFFGLILIGIFIIKHLFEEDQDGEKEETEKDKKSPIVQLFNKVAHPTFKVKEIKDTEPKAKEQPQQKEISLQKAKKTEKVSFLGEYKFPPLELLEEDHGQPTSGDIANNSAIIKRTLENFGIPVQMAEVFIGPTVTQYTLKPAEGIKLSKITTLNNDLSLALASHPIRIEAPIPGKPLVGIEMPNKVRAQVRMRNLVSQSTFQNANSTLNFVLGRDVAGNPIFADIRKMPHMLIAGSTGTGKTICLNTVITSLLYRNSPETLKLILVDPKRVEFTIYSDIPHLLCPIIYDAQKTLNALRWLVKEMERRFIVLAEARTRDINLYNDLVIKENGREILPFIVLIIDELADLMSARGKELEAGIVRLAQMARAVGIHLVLATQRPSVEVITGLIKANITSRIAFQVASHVDSRTILDAAGAEKLLGAGDLLFLSNETGKPRRIQGAYTSEKEVKKVTDFLREVGANMKELISSEHQELAMDLQKELEAQDQANLFPTSGEGISDFESYEDDPLLEEAKKIVIEARKASASLLQRRLRVGYARAARLLDILEEKGIVGPSDGAKPREVFVNQEENISGQEIANGQDILEQQGITVEKEGQEKKQEIQEVTETEEVKEPEDEWKKI